MTDLEIKLKNTQALREVWLEDADTGGVFVAGAEHVPAAERVKLRLEVGTDVFTLRGRVVWRRTKRGGGGRFGIARGAAVAFDADQEVAVRRLMALARDVDVNVAKRASKRTPLSLQIRYHSRFSLDRDLVRDVSLGGLRVHSEAPLKVGDKVVIFLRPPRALFPLKLESEVVWSDPKNTEFGVKFLKTTPRDKRRLQRLVTSLG